MTRILLTGATGNMGWAGMQEILRYPDKYQLRILARPSQVNKTKLAPLSDKIEIVWGDLTSYEDVLKAVTGVDIVLHVGGMVSPQADYRPTQTRKVNLLAATYIRDAVLAQPEKQQPKVVYVGSVAQMGDRREPLHWGRTGDPLCASAYDHYGLTKIRAEWIITNSPIKKWVSLRQSGILYPAIIKNFDPIMFHVPIRGVLEWATVEDSGRLLERVCREEVPDEFWNHYYNIGSGESYRLSNYEFEQLLLKAVGCPSPTQIFDSQWFVTRNFHGMWYLDGDKLENFLHFRANILVEQYFEQMAQSALVPLGIRFAGKTKVAKLFPHIIKLVMGRLANSTEHGTQWWIKNNIEQRIHAYYGSLEAYKNIPAWDKMDLSHNSNEAVLLEHGYDEKKPKEQLCLQDMQQAAMFRGGKCLSETMQTGDWDTPLRFECAEGHTFEASPRVILLGGHWCIHCLPNPYKDNSNAVFAETGATERPWQWDKEARQNPFFAQLWQPLHDKNEDNTYGREIFEGWEK
ncbi:MAG: NAD(P)-dependent oxidoreductase [Paludibacteraceae bacterium]|nr:NAD(P)-dependent oxidoreductase [Paludibacteraceae bacterium]